jgi:hypothetical protein
LAQAEAELAEIEQRGDSLTRFRGAVKTAETQLYALAFRAQDAAIRKLALAHYGWDVPTSKIPEDKRRELALHVSVVELQQFTAALPAYDDNDITQLQQRLDVVGKRLLELRDMIEARA